MTTTVLIILINEKLYDNLKSKVVMRMPQRSSKSRSQSEACFAFKVNPSESVGAELLCAEVINRQLMGTR